MSGANHKMLINPSQVTAKLDAEARRLAAIRDGSHPPAECGPAIIPAPARGASVVVRHVAMVPNGKDARGLDQWAAAPSGYGHRASVAAADVFDLMLDAARRARRPAPLSPGQVAQARRYRALVERLEAGGVKLSRLDGVAGGGDFMDAFMQVSAEVEAMRRRIGSGTALAVRRIRPSARGSQKTIGDRVLVDMVCLGGMSLSKVLEAHGWAAKGPTRKALQEALCGALDRMIGYR